MAIFTLLARLGLDTTEFSSGIKRAQSGAAGLGKDLRRHIGGQLAGIGTAIAGAFTVGAVTSFVGQLTHMADEIRDVAELLGISTDEVQRMQKAAGDAGVSFGSIVNAFQRIEQYRAKAQSGDEGAMFIFNRLRVDPSKLTAMQIFKQAIDESAKGTFENAAAFELLGKKVTGFKLVADELRNQGPIKLISEDDLKRLDQANKKLEEALRLFKVQSTPAAAAGLGYAGDAIQGLSSMSGKDFWLSIAEGNLNRMAQWSGASGNPFNFGDLTAGGVDTAALPLPAGYSKGANGQEDFASFMRRTALATEKMSDAITQNVQR